MIYVNTIYIDQLVNEFENENFVQEVSYDLPLIELINTNIQVLNRWLVFLGSAFFLLSIILMNNTIRLSVYSNRLIIKTMQLVGATKSFIKKPFILRQLTLGLCSWLLSSIIFLVLLYYLKNNFYDFSFKNIAESLAISGLISFLVCIIISYVSTSIITGKFINSKIDNLYWWVKKQFAFGRRNYKFMFIGIAIIALGFLLMSGGGSDDPNVFNEEIYNLRRIRLAPALVIIGFAVEVYAILTKPE